MSRPSGLGKVGSNGTLNENGAFYSVQDINVLLKNVSGDDGSGGSDGSGSPSLVVTESEGEGEGVFVLDKNYNEIKGAVDNGTYIMVKIIDTLNDDVAIFIGQVVFVGTQKDLLDPTSITYVVVVQSNFEGEITSLSFKADSPTDVLSATSEGDEI